MPELRTVVTFQSVFFNTSEQKGNFNIPNCFGEDVCKWLIQRLRDGGAEIDSDPLQEHIGWCFNFTVPQGEHRCLVGYRPGSTDAQAGLWIAWIEKNRGFLGSLLGGRGRGVASSAVTSIHIALSGATEIGSVRWHFRKDFDQGREDLARLAP